MSYVWSELVKFAQAGEKFVEGTEEHIAVLTARLLHHERAQQAAAPATAPEPAKAETPATPAT